jgi:hypothetical protein
MRAPPRNGSIRNHKELLTVMRLGARRKACVADALDAAE